MSLQEKMYLEVESWMSSEEPKLKFLEGKEYSEAKFNYWLAKWKGTKPTIPQQNPTNIGTPL